MKKVVLIVAALFYCAIVLGVAQNVDLLRGQMQQYEREIAQINKLINSNKAQQSNASQNLKLINQKIESRKKIIRNLDSQISIVESRLGQEGVKIVELNGSLSALKASYATLVKLAYMNYRNNSPEAVLSSGESYSQKVRNIANIEKITSNCLVRATQIDTLKTSINTQMSTLKDEQTRLNSLIKDKAHEASELEKEKTQVAAINKNLQNQSGELKKKAEESRKRMQVLQRQIEDIIAQESRSTGSAPVNVQLSGEFQQNRGRLPSPVGGGVVVDKFGLHSHPTQSGIKINNNGINIACSNNASVKAVFNGEVKRMFLVPGMGNSIIVRHGKFLTVYSNLNGVSVKIGDVVSTGQKLGTVSNSENILHFEVWNETTVLNPEEWIII